MTLPLDKKFWNASGSIDFSLHNQTSQQEIMWRPKHKNSFLRCILPERNLSRFNAISIDMEDYSGSKAWFFVYLHDTSHYYVLSYFQLNPDNQGRIVLSFQKLFSSFTHSPDFNWNRVRSFSLVSHPSANLGIERTHLHIREVVFSLERDSIRETGIIVPDPVLAPILMNNSTWNMVRDLANSGDHRLMMDALHIINQSSARTRLNDAVSLETLRNASFNAVLTQNKELEELILKKTVQFSPSYWKRLHEVNDILVQEEALFLIQLFDTLKPSILDDPIYYHFFKEVLNYIAILEMKTCYYWIHYYPHGKGNNHVTRAACILAIIALIYPEAHEKREEWLHFSFNVLDYYIDFQVSEEGVLNEGTHYYVYLMETLSYLAYYLMGTSGQNLFNDFSFSKKLTLMIQWTHHIETPDGFLPCVDDSWPTRVVFPKLFLKPFFSENDPDFFWKHHHQFWNLTKASYFPLFLINASKILSCDASKNCEIKQIQQNKTFYSDSQSVFRSNNGTHPYYLFIAGKNLFSLHEHESAGSFQYYMGETPIITVSGYGPNGWTSSQRSFYVSGKAHNTIMVDGYAPKAFYNGGVGPIDTTSLETWQDISETGFAHMNISWDFRFQDLSHQRSFVFFPDHDLIQGYLLVIDHIASKIPRTYQANLHPVGTYLYRNMTQAFFSPENHPKPSITKIYHCPPWTKKIAKGFQSNYWGEEFEKDYLQYSYHGTDAFLATLIQGDKNVLQKDKILSSHQTGSIHELMVNHADAKDAVSDSFLVNPYQLIQGTKHISSNAYFAHIRYNKSDMKPVQCYVNNGDHLNYQKKNIFYANRPLTLSMVYNADYSSLIVKYHANFADTRFFFHETNIEQIMLNKETLHFDQFGDKIGLILPEGRHTLQFLLRTPGSDEVKKHE